MKLPACTSHVTFLDSTSLSYLLWSSSTSSSPMLEASVPSSWISDSALSLSSCPRDSILSVWNAGGYFIFCLKQCSLVSGPSQVESAALLTQRALEIECRLFSELCARDAESQKSPRVFLRTRVSGFGGLCFSGSVFIQQKKRKCRPVVFRW